MKEELKKECSVCGSDDCNGWEAELAELLDENKPTKIRDFVRFLLAKQQEEFVKIIKGMELKPDADNMSDLDFTELAYNQALYNLLAYIKSKLNI